MNTWLRSSTAFAAGILLYSAIGWCESIVDTRHNLSKFGPGPVKSDVEEEVCIFCHTPHRAREDTPYLWNRADTEAEFIPYTSSTLHATVGQPTGASKMCLSCHDGTIALGAVLSRPQEISFPAGLQFLPADRPAYLGTDLSDDHPVSFVYDVELAERNGELVPPSYLPENVKRDKDGMLQCTSCHDPHDDSNGRFLVMSNSHSALCISCHDRTDWPSSSHATSTAGWNNQGNDPWPHTDYATVAENACANCHRSHDASGHQRLLNQPIEGASCLDCHNGNVAAKDIAAELDKLYGHPIQDYSGVHDAAENFGGTVNIHVECVDCHNSHRTDNSTAIAPFVPGALRGVKGVDADGNPVDSAEYLYEVCLKCHAGSNIFLPATYAPIVRQDPQLDLRLDFDTTNASYHPVLGAGSNSAGSVPSLLPPYTNTSVIYCTDCHNNDSGLGPRGPHGSDNRYLLELNYTTSDNTEESSFEYAMCYKCHDRNKILNDASGFPHGLHLGATVNAPCSACHDPHGSLFNTHLINFDTNIVTPSNSGRLEFTDNGLFTGSCDLMCHGQNHSGAWRYP